MDLFALIVGGVIVYAFGLLSGVFATLLLASFAAAGRDDDRLGDR